MPSLAADAALRPSRLRTVERDGPELLGESGVRSGSSAEAVAGPAGELCGCDADGDPVDASSGVTPLRIRRVVGGIASVDDGAWEELVVLH